MKYYVPEGVGADKAYDLGTNQFFEQKYQAFLQGSVEANQEFSTKLYLGTDEEGKTVVTEGVPPINALSSIFIPRDVMAGMTMAAHFARTGEADKVENLLQAKQHRQLALDVVAGQAVSGNHAEIADFVINAGASSKDLMPSVRSAEMIDMLVDKHGADVNEQNQWGRNAAFNIAVSNTVPFAEKKNLIGWLYAKGIDLNAPEKSGQTLAGHLNGMMGRLVNESPDKDIIGDRIGDVFTQYAKDNGLTEDYKQSDRETELFSKMEEITNGDIIKKEEMKNTLNQYQDVGIAQRLSQNIDVLFAGYGEEVKTMSLSNFIECLGAKQPEKEVTQEEISADVTRQLMKNVREMMYDNIEEAQIPFGTGRPRDDLVKRQNDGNNGNGENGPRKPGGRAP